MRFRPVISRWAAKAPPDLPLADLLYETVQTDGESGPLMGDCTVSRS